MKFIVLTIFPDLVNSYLQDALLKKAVDKKLIEVEIVDIRNFTKDAHRSIDDAPYGGGAGMIMTVGPIFRSLTKSGIRSARFASTGRLLAPKGRKQRVILLSAKGRQFSQKIAKDYARLDELVFICGRYEGVDERVARYLADEEISLGPFVLSGGELAALAILEATARLIKGVLGNKESLREESFSFKGDKVIVEYPHYSRPENFSPAPGVSWRVPKVLLSGNHAKIEQWRQKNKRIIKT